MAPPFDTNGLAGVDAVQWGFGCIGADMGMDSEGWGGTSGWVGVEARSCLLACYDMICMDGTRRNNGFLYASCDYLLCVVRSAILQYTLLSPSVYVYLYFYDYVRVQMRIRVGIRQDVSLYLHLRTVRA